MVWCSLHSGTNCQNRVSVNPVLSFNKCNIYSSIFYCRELACKGSLSISETYDSELSKGQFLGSDFRQPLHYSSLLIRDMMARHRIRSQTRISTTWFFSCSGTGSYVPELAQNTGRSEPFVTLFSKAANLIGILIWHCSLTSASSDFFSLIKPLCFLLTLRQSSPNFCNHQILISIRVSSAYTSYIEIHTKHINTLCRQSIKLLNGGTYSNHSGLQCQITFSLHQ